MHGGEKDCIKTAKPQKGEVIVLLQNNSHGDVVLLLVGFGLCWVLMLVGLLDFFTKNPSEAPSIHYNQRHDIGNTERTMDVIMYLKILPQSFPSFSNIF